MCLSAYFSETVQYHLQRAEGVQLSMREACEALNAITGGKGGGRDAAAQGSAKAQAGFAELLCQYEGYLKQRLKGL